MRLNPGSDEAIKEGCTCPVMDNYHGEGAYRDSDGNPVFWYSGDCPVHGKAEDVDPETVLYPMEG